MRRAALVLTFCLLAMALARPAAAQRLRAGTGLIGLSLGATFGELTGEAVASSDYRPGWFFGGYGQYLFADHFAFEFEANWIAKGGNSIATTGGDTVDVRLTYIELPLLLNFVLPVAESWVVRLYAGGTLSLRTSCDVKLGAEFVFCGGTTPVGDANATEWSSPFGANVGYRLADDDLIFVLDLRYSVGWSDVFQSVDARTRYFAILARLDHRF